VAQAVQARCGECGLFVRRRLDVLNGAYDDLADAYNEAEYVTEWEEHDCQAAASLAPRAGEYDAWLAELDAGAVADVSEETWAQAMAGVVAEAEAITRTAPAPWTATGEQLTLGGGTDGQHHEPPTVRARLHAGMSSGGRRATRRADARVAAPWAPIDASAARPGRRSHARPGRPLPYLPAPVPAERAARPGRGRGGGGQGATVGRDRAAAAPERRRGGLRLSRLLRWFQQDDPRLTRPLERTARAVEWVERLYDVE
jgi:hypothetical protein